MGLHGGVMYFSGKITNSFCVFLNRFIGLDDSQLFGMTSLETEFIKDPNSWMRAAYVENFLRNIRSAHQDKFPDKDLIATVGHSFHDLDSWGGLDKFLKMFKTSRDIYKKLDVVFRYFLSDFKLMGTHEEETGLTFKTSFQSEKYPAAADYLKAVLEQFSVFLGESMTEAKWERCELKVYYPSEENLILPLKELKKPPAPVSKSLLIKKISACERLLRGMGKTARQPALERQALTILSDMKAMLRDEEGFPPAGRKPQSASRKKKPAAPKAAKPVSRQ